jgi:hypothetical protein
VSHHIPHYNPTKHTEKTTTAFTPHSLQNYSTNPSSPSSLSLPWPLASPPPQPHQPLAKTKTQAVPVKTRAKTRVKAPFKALRLIRVPVKPPPASQASTRCAATPSPHSPLCWIVSNSAQSPGPHLERELQRGPEMQSPRQVTRMVLCSFLDTLI